MSDQSQPDRFKAEMPQIPGVSAAGAQRQPITANPAVFLVGGLLVVLVVCFVAARWLLHSKPTEATAPAAPAQIEVPTPAVDATPAIPRVTASNPVVATIAEMAKPWASKEFVFVDRFSNESTPALLIRLSTASASQADGYWALSMKAPYGSCALEYVDAAKLKEQYDFSGARHPMVGDPCSRTVFDPLKMTEIPGNIFVRGSIVQGSDLRPPLGIEVQIQAKNILAVRME